MNKNLIITLIIFCLALSFRLIAIEKKTFIHHDEPLSFASSTVNNALPTGALFKFDWWRFDVDNYEYNIEDFKKSFFQSNSSPTSIINDLKDLHKGNIEVEHTNLYYSFLRIWNIGLDGTNRKECIKRGCYLNILFFIIEFFFMFKLLNLIKENDYKLINLGLFFAFLNTAGISNTLLIREYAMAEMFFVIATYFAFLLLKEKNPDNKLIFLSSTVFGLLALSNYMLLVYDGILALFLLGYKFYKKEAPVKILIIIVLAFFWIFLIYPTYCNAFFVNQYKEYIDWNMQHLQIHMFLFDSFVFYKSIVAAIVIFTLLISRKIFSGLILVILPSLIWLLIIMWLVPWANIRFIFPAIPILSLMFAMFLYYFKITYITVISLLYLVLTIMPLFDKTFSYTKIDYLYGDAEQYEVNILKNTTIPTEKYPVVVYNSPEKTWYYTYWYFIKLENKGQILFTDELPDKNFIYKKFFLILYLTDKNDPYLTKYCNTKLDSMKSWTGKGGVYAVCFVETDKAD